MPACSICGPNRLVVQIGTTPIQPGSAFGRIEHEEIEDVWCTDVVVCFETGPKIRFTAWAIELVEEVVGRA